MVTTTLNISADAYEILQNCLERNLIKLTSFNKEKLSEELKNAQVLPDEELPADVVKISSKVHLQEINSKKDFRFHLVKPAEANPLKNKISAIAPISVAILGYRQGDMVDWEMPGGLKKYRIVSVENS